MVASSSDAPHSVKDLEEELIDYGVRLFTPPSSNDELLSILDKVETLLVHVAQAPSETMKNALHPIMKALIGSELLGHSDEGVTVSVVLCLTEIMRITAPQQPYDDAVMKEIFQQILETFEKLSHVKSHCYSKTVQILDNISKVRAMVLLLDLDCDKLVIDLFKLFLRIVSSSHGNDVFTNMEEAMIWVIKECDEVSGELLMPLLDSIKNENQKASSVSWKLGQNVLKKCSDTVRPCVVKAVKSMSLDIDGYAGILASICHEVTEEDLLDQTKKEKSPPAASPTGVVSSVQLLLELQEESTPKSIDTSNGNQESENRSKTDQTEQLEDTNLSRHPKRRGGKSIRNHDSSYDNCKDNDAVPGESPVLSEDGKTPVILSTENEGTAQSGTTSSKRPLDTSPVGVVSSVQLPPELQHESMSKSIDTSNRNQESENRSKTDQSENLEDTDRPTDAQHHSLEDMQPGTNLGRHSRRRGGKSMRKHDSSYDHCKVKDSVPEETPVLSEDGKKTAPVILSTENEGTAQSGTILSKRPLATSPVGVVSSVQLPLELQQESTSKTDQTEHLEDTDRPRPTDAQHCKVNDAVPEESPVLSEDGKKTAPAILSTENEGTAQSGTTSSKRPLATSLVGVESSVQLPLESQHELTPKSIDTSNRNQESENRSKTHQTEHLEDTDRPTDAQHHSLEDIQPGTNLSKHPRRRGRKSMKKHDSSYDHCELNVPEESPVLSEDGKKTSPVILSTKNEGTPQSGTTSSKDTGNTDGKIRKRGRPKKKQVDVSLEKGSEGNSSKAEPKRGSRKKEPTARYNSEKSLGTSTVIKKDGGLPSADMSLLHKNDNLSKENIKTNSVGKKTLSNKKVTATTKAAHGEELVGAKIKVWWPMDRQFYEGEITSFDHVKKKHKVLYFDGEEENLNLARQRWEVLKEIPPDKDCDSDSPISSAVDRTKKRKGGTSREQNPSTSETKRSRRKVKRRLADKAESNDTTTQGVQPSKNENNRPLEKGNGSPVQSSVRTPQSE